MSIDAILLIGPTGAGKSPLGDHIERRGLSGRRCLHFDFGHQLRSAALSDRPPEELTEAEHLFIKDVLEKALLLEQQHFPIAQKIVSAFVRSRQYAEGDLMVLNGLPRHIDQAVAMDSIVSVGAVVVLECTAEVVRARIRTDAGGDRSGRDDDETGLIEKKLALFRERTEALIDHYAGRDCRVLRISISEETAAEDAYLMLLESLG